MMDCQFAVEWILNTIKTKAD